MNLPLFIAKRIAANSTGSFSGTIHRIAVISTAVSLSALIVSFFVLFGFKQAIRDKVYHLNGHLTVNKYALTQSLEDNSIKADDVLMTGLNTYPGILHTQRYVLKWGLLKSSGGVEGVFVKGVGADAQYENLEKQLVDGKLPSWESDESLYDVVISQKLAQLLQIAIGDELMLFFVQQPPRYRKIRITGLYATGMEEFDEKVILGSLSLLQKLNGWDAEQVSGVEVFLDDYRQIDEMEEKLFDFLPVDINVVSSHRQYPQIFEWLELLNRNVLILLVIILVVAGLGMISMVLILIMERTRMVGMLKALGATSKLLQKVFIYTGLSLIVKGLLIGNFVGLGLCALQYWFHIIPLDPTNYYMEFVPIQFDPVTLVGLNLLMILLIGLTLLIPAQLVGRIRPVQSIRFE